MSFPLRANLNARTHERKLFGLATDPAMADGKIDLSSAILPS